MLTKSRRLKTMQKLTRVQPTSLSANFARKLKSSDKEVVEAVVALVAEQLTLKK